MTVEGPKPASHACTSSAISTVAPAARLLQPPLPRQPAVSAGARLRRNQRPIGGEVEGATDEEHRVGSGVGWGEGGSAPPPI